MISHVAEYCTAGQHDGDLSSCTLLQSKGSETVLEERLKTQSSLLHLGRFVDFCTAAPGQSYKLVLEKNSVLHMAQVELLPAGCLIHCTAEPGQPYILLPGKHKELALQSSLLNLGKPYA